MSADKFMLDLFLTEARTHVGMLSGAVTGELPPKNGAAAAGGLKGLALMLGFAKLGDVCAKLENILSSENVSAENNADILNAMASLKKCAAATSDSLVQTVEECGSDFDKFLNAEISLDAGRAETKAENNAGQVSQKTATNVDKAMLPLFISEVDNQLNALGSGLIDLENDFGNAAKIEPLMRASHSLKGAARVVGLTHVVELTHEMENCFVAAQSGKITLDSDSLDIFFSCIDFISTLAAKNFSEIDTDRLNALIVGLKALGDNNSAGAAPPFDNAKYSSFAPPSDDGIEREKHAGRSNTSVRVSAKSLNSLMELAAESLIENRRIEPFRESLAGIKDSHDHIIRQIESAISSLEGIQGTGAAIMRLEQLRKSMLALGKSLRGNIDGLDDYARKNVLISGRLYSEVLASRMRPFSEGLQGFPRMVRDIAKSSGKKIMLEISGKDVPVDRDVLEKLDSPITHILRNACDHAIEFPDERTRAGKPETGVISLRARHSAGLLLVTISDDGKGINEEAVRKKILERNLVAPEILAQMSREEIFEFLFLPGFTTKESVSEISGRGVGLDVVQSMLRDVGGRISITSVKGKGTSFIMKLPITRSVLKALVVSIDSQPYAFSLGKIYRTIKLDPSKITREEGYEYLNVSGNRAILINSATTLGLQKSKRTMETCVVVISDKDKYYGLEVDSLPTESELVVRPLNSKLGKIPGVAAASLTEDGFPILILDTDDLMKHIDKFLLRGETRIEKKSPSKRILLVDDSATVRETQRKILEGAGYAVDAAVDGLDGWNSVRLCIYDLIVSDIDMPRMGGIEFVEKIRSGAKCPDIPVLIVSYKDREEDRARAMKAGASAYITKNSFQDGSFLKTVKELMENNSRNFCKKA